MANRDRMVNEFLELVQIDSLTKNERQMADVLKRKLQEMGFPVYEDDAAGKIGGNTGNLICTVEGEEGIPPILLMAHMDTVVPGNSIKPIVEGNIIKTDGSTILGGDDAAGIECVLEALRVLKEENAKHGSIYIVFAVAEEGGLLGAKNLDYTRLPCKYGFVLDSGGPIGTVAVRAPSQNQIYINVIGKSTHAGLEPENGINAIQIASEAISQMTLGRIDAETTSNIGIIKGGQATNIVCGKVEIQAEARSRNEEKLEAQTNHMKECFEKAALKFGGSVEFRVEREYSAFNITEEDEIISILREASDKLGIELLLEPTGGGSDTNIINEKGIQAVNISVGMNKVHSVEENISIDDMVKAAGFLLEIIKAVK